MLLFAIIGLEVSIHTYPVILAKHLSIITKQDNNQIPVHKGKLPNLPLESLAFYPSLRQKRKRKGTFRCSLRLE